jgi:protein disulfide-isomerase A1
VSSLDCSALSFLCLIPPFPPSLPPFFHLHSKTLEPKWDVLGEKLSAVEHVMIAKMDYTANELDVAGIDIKGFPTILFFPAANKAEPVVYKQEREVNTFVAFLKEHASKPFEVAVDAVEEEDEEEDEEEEKDEL